MRRAAPKSLANGSTTTASKRPPEVSKSHQTHIVSPPSAQLPNHLQKLRPKTINSNSKFKETVSIVTHLFNKNYSVHGYNSCRPFISFLTNQHKIMVQWDLSGIFTACILLHNQLRYESCYHCQNIHRM